MGPRDDFVVTGSDCGHIFIWCKTTGRLLRVMHGDNDVVNCLEPHPNTLLLASSGMDTVLSMAFQCLIVGLSSE